MTTAPSGTDFRPYLDDVKRAIDDADPTNIHSIAVALMDYLRYAYAVRTPMRDIVTAHRQATDDLVVHIERWRAQNDIRPRSTQFEANACTAIDLLERVDGMVASPVPYVFDPTLLT